jgi:uncharacterized membrane protein
MTLPLDLTLALLAAGVAVALRPWRAVPRTGPPWPWLVLAAALPLLWSADRLVAIPVAQPLSFASLLMLMAGWPMAVLAMGGAALLMALGGLDAAEALHRLVWLGLVPATVAMALGAAVRRWLPRHLIVYILGRGFFATALAATVAGTASALLSGSPRGLGLDDLILARWLAAWGDATLTGMLVAIFVAYRPQWLATYADRIYLR